jgi:hypothetical protein
MVGVAADEVSVIFAGNVYCAMIEVCQEIADFDRAARWTAALTTWCAGQAGNAPQPLVGIMTAGEVSP